MSDDNIPGPVRDILAAQNKTYISIDITASGDDQTFAFDREDYTPETHAVASAMAKATTDQSRNVNKLTIGQRITSISQNGVPAPIANGGPGSANPFAALLDGTLNSEEVYRFITLSNSEQLGINVIKGLGLPPENENQKNWIELINDVNNRLGDSELSQEVTRVSEENNNGFSANSQLLRDGEIEEESSIGRIQIQKDFGTHSPQKYPNTLTTTSLRVQNLKNLGVQLLLKGSGEYFVAENIDNAAEALAQKATSLAPGLSRLGLKTSLDNMSPEDIVREYNSDFVKPKNPELKGRDLSSWGSPYNPLAPFDAIDTRLSVAGAAVLLGTCSGIIFGISEAVNPNSAGFDIANQIAGNKRSPQVILQTKNDFQACVQEGFKLFFGLEGDDFLSSLGSSGRRFNEEPGYFNVILRGLIRMVQYDLVANALAPINTGVGASQSSNLATTVFNKSLEIDPNIGLSSDVLASFNGFKKFLDSKLLAFINVLAQMGDISLGLSAQGFEKSLDPMKVGTSFEDRISDNVNGEHLNLMSAVFKNRLSPSTSTNILGLGINNLNKGASAFSNSATPSAYILPDSIYRGASLLDKNSQTLLQAKLAKEPGFKPSGTDNRLSSDLVDEIENYLETSYVPFYFHDLRTNEIISFHAFLENITDSYAVDYAETTGYGRIGKTYSYKNTDRTIGLSFIVAAMGQDDFERMWWKINKLITLVYPQYTAGRQLEFYGEKFTQPFSQLPSSSPLIRIRLGDLFKSNYSKFNLARLFGLGQDEETFTINSQGAAFNYEQAARTRAVSLDIRRRMLRYDYQNGEKFQIRFLKTPNIRELNGLFLIGSVSPVPTPRGRTSRAANRTTGNQASRGRGRAGNITSAPQPLAGEKIATVISRTEESDVFVYTITLDGIPGKQYQIRIPNALNLGDDSIPPADSTYTYAISPSDTEIRRLVAAQLNAEGIQEPSSAEINSSQDVVNFFSEQDGGNATQGNPIVKAFSSVRGKGLAGFIKSIDFDWNMATWDVDSGRKAPKMCKVTINFAPVHDLNPGIDANGFNTAPIYQVGNISTATNVSIQSDRGSNDNTTDVVRTASNANETIGNPNEEG